MQVFKELEVMNQTNQLRGESQNYKFWFEAKKIGQNDQSTRLCTKELQSHQAL